MLYKFGANVKSTDNRNNTILHYFCGSGDLEGVKFALQFIDINDKAYNNFVPLHAAAYKNRFNFCEYLCTLPELDKNAKSQDVGLTPLGYAIVRNHKETVNVLKKFGCA
ncbi:hypothetical protein TVAG_142080 [Trichomonas vaginalis G3]|uniref:Uncharacterized protein n=1 Tax=Trichomonas vaginalis (strain ATCC PRA-98 / G3) TaxID=412133 RepID=A2FWS1_TRIV3|nr:proteasome regulatory particle assembly [Trichomonas vaginalis G3]EAX90664.1 hypothetical protein TVAG_142080 [Trichomonas vaginalis G3]KAI5553852.1 proteasome regulatory particle assembly [Trichomonas vaginalis G3]|eukprot:XP_001303594.1 hypothetical protein [Trichomonas vaginalis G3]